MNIFRTSAARDLPAPPWRHPPEAAAARGSAWYEPSPAAISASQLTAFTREFATAAGTRFDSHDALHRFTVTEFRKFWSFFLDWSALKWSGDATEVCTTDICETATFFPRVRLNYAENVLSGRNVPPDSIAVVSLRASQDRVVLTRQQLREQVEAMAHSLRERGLSEGDHVVAIMRNDSEAVVAALAVAAVGASIASAAPEMGAEAIVERFGLLQPAMLLAHTSPRAHDSGMPVADRVARVARELPALKLVVALDDGPLPQGLTSPCVAKSALIAESAQASFDWRRFAFNQPLFIMASSGTTGRPKCIVHGTGGTLLEHVKEHRLHGNLGIADRLYFHTSCAWMMWQWQLTALASCEGIVLFDGPVQDPRALWRAASGERATVFGTSPAYLKFSEDSGVEPAHEFDLSALRAVMSTGAVLYDAQYHWFRRHVGALPLQSISGGTDIIGCFVLGNPNLPVHAGEAQCRSLALDVQALPIPGSDKVGELICANPFPSRPLGFHGDPDGERFHASYFAANAGVWTHGDLIEFSPQGGARIHGRSDGVLNVRGIRIGPAEIYKVLREFGDIRDAMVVEQRVPEQFRDGRAVLFVVLNSGCSLDAALSLRIRRRLAEALSPAHVPDLIVAATDLPYTYSGKPSEAALTAAVNGQAVRNARALRNAECLDGVGALLAPPSRETDAALARENLERYLQAVWERAFCFAPIGHDDDFFEIGGHSLMAAQVLAETSQAIGRDLPLATLLRAPTIRQLAAACRESAAKPHSELLLPLREGTGQPFFIIHSMAGALLEMWAVLRALEADRPVWGIQARGLEDGQEPRLRVQEMAADYLQLVRTVQPHGPYSFGGYSFGGLVAFEMACQLQQAGDKMDLLMLVDAQVDGRFLPMRQQCSNILRRSAERTRLFLSLDLAGKSHYVYTKGLAFVDRVRVAVGMAPRHPEFLGNPLFEAGLSPTLRRIRGAMLLATRAYKPSAYAGKVVFVRPETPGPNEPLPAWQRAIRGQIVLETSPGDHLSMIRDENALALARVISRYLADVDTPAVS